MSDPHLVAKIWAADRLAGDIDPLLTSARTNFALGDYETAAFAAMKAVEVEVRRVSGLPNESLGVALMRKAFSPKDGVLRDPKAEGGEQQATADLFAGAMGAYKNPASHRPVQFNDAVEAAEIIQLADLLLRIVHRAEARTKD
ncbi:TIGR02391 family protein [Cryptosporangium phraense]|uniref:TIGR02391 family protein n=1 Tax=Cryptosporangium phraense TaxID=2593070 RepID=UPI001478B3F9|nr:TIGR02391 family protein [Cryptosporangium phraense]